MFKKSLLSSVIFFIASQVLSQTSIELEHLYYTRPYLNNDGLRPMKKNVGHVMARKLKFQGKTVYFDLKNSGTIKADLYMSLSALELVSTNQSIFGIDRRELGIFNDFKKIKTQNFIFSSGGDDFGIEASHLSLGFDDYELSFNNFSLACGPLESLSFPYNCLNGVSSSALRPQDFSSQIEIFFANAKEKLKVEAAISEALIENKSLRLSLDKLEYKQAENYVLLEKAKLDCTKNEIKNNFIDGISMMLECINNGKFIFPEFKIFIGEFQMEGFKYDFKTLDNKIILGGEKLTFHNNFFNIIVNKLKSECLKFNIEENLSIDEILKNCYKWSSVKAEKIIYSDEKKNKGQFSFEGIGFKGDEISIAASWFNLYYDDLLTSIDLKRLVASCPKKRGLKKMKFAEIINYCLSNTKLNLSFMSIIGPDYRLEIETGLIGLEKNKFSIIGKSLKYISSDTTVLLEGINIDCLRKINLEEDFDFESLSQGCFESSSMKINSIMVENNKFKMKLDIKGIDFNQKKISLNIPKATYWINKSKVEFSNLEFTCLLDHKINKVENFTVDNTLEICLNHSILKISKLKNIDDSGIQFASLESTKSIFFDSLYLSGINFHLKLRPIMEYIGLIRPNLIRGTVKGKISYDKINRKIVLKIASFTIWRFLPAKKVLMWIIDSFIDHQYVTIDNDIIYIHLK